MQNHTRLSHSIGTDTALDDSNVDFGISEQIFYNSHILLTYIYINKKRTFLIVNKMMDDEVQDYSKITRFILMTCIGVGTMAPIPGATIALILPAGAILWKRKIELEINKRILDFFH